MDQKQETIEKERETIWKQFVEAEDCGGIFKYALLNAYLCLA